MSDIFTPKPKEIEPAILRYSQVFILHDVCESMKDTIPKGANVVFYFDGVDLDDKEPWTIESFPISGSNLNRVDYKGVYYTYAFEDEGLFETSEIERLQQWNPNYTIWVHS